jgi:hypothetical protein
MLPYPEIKKYGSLLSKDIHHKISLVVLPSENQSLSKLKMTPSLEQITNAVTSSLNYTSGEEPFDDASRKQFFSLLSSNLKALLTASVRLDDEFAADVAVAVLNKVLSIQFAHDHGFISLNEAAKQMHLSTRTLQDMLIADELMFENRPTKKAVASGISVAMLYGKKKRFHTFVLWDKEYLEKALAEQNFCYFSLFFAAKESADYARCINGIISVLDADEVSREFALFMMRDFEFKVGFDKTMWHHAYYALYELLTKQNERDVIIKLKRVLDVIRERKESSCL